jgi:hypothetical protein
MRATVLTLIAAATLATAQSGSIPTCKHIFLFIIPIADNN